MTIQLKTLFLGLVLCFAAASAHAEGISVESRKAYAIELLQKILGTDYKVIAESVELQNSYHPLNVLGQIMGKSMEFFNDKSTDFEVIRFKVKAGGHLMAGWSYLSTTVGCVADCTALENAKWSQKTFLKDGRVVYSQLYPLSYGNDWHLNLEKIYK